MTGVAEDLAGLLAKATPVPWRGVPSDDYQIEASAYPRSYTHSFKGDDTGSALAVFGNRPADFGEANRDLVVAAVNALPHLLSEIATIRADLAAAREALAPFALDVKDTVPGHQMMVAFAWTADEIRAARKALSIGNQEDGA